MAAAAANAQPDDRSARAVGAGVAFLFAGVLGMHALAIKKTIRRALYVVTEESALILDGFLWQQKPLPLAEVWDHCSPEQGVYPDPNVDDDDVPTDRFILRLEPEAVEGFYLARRGRDVVLARLWSSEAGTGAWNAAEIGFAACDDVPGAVAALKALLDRHGLLEARIPVEAPP